MAVNSGALYITYDGLLDPLGQSQVVGYVRGLRARGWAVRVLSFEKRNRLHHHECRELRRTLAAEGIPWLPLRYHQRPSALATTVDVVAGIVCASWLVFRYRLRLVHTRSYVASMIGWSVKRLLGTAWIFDMRGLWADERVDGNWWTRDSLLYRIAKSFERHFLRSADRIVVLTEGLKNRLLSLPAIQASPHDRITVIPTCVDLKRFGTTPHHGDGHQDPALPADRLIYAYVGSVGSLYLLRDMAKFFLVAKAHHPDVLLLLLINGDRHAAWHEVAEAGVRQDDCLVFRVPYDRVAGYLRQAHVSLCFTKACDSKIGSFPTKIAESLACGVPVVVNRGSSDVDALIERYGVGVLVNELSETAYALAREQVDRLLDDPLVHDRCRQAASDRLSLERGVDTYERLYRVLTHHSALPSCASESVIGESPALSSEPLRAQAGGP